MSKPVSPLTALPNTRDASVIKLVKDILAVFGNLRLPKFKIDNPGIYSNLLYVVQQSLYKPQLFFRWSYFSALALGKNF